MRERQNAKSLGAVHTHTHTHTHKSLFNGKIWPFKDVMSTKQICWTVWREREQCLAKTGRVFCTQKIEKTGKRINIISAIYIYILHGKRKLPCAKNLGYKEMAEAF